MVEAIVGGVFLGLIILLYNSLIGKKNEVENAFGGLDAHLKQRFDLIPNLVASVRQYMTHESSLLEKIVELRSNGLRKNLNQNEMQGINKELSRALSGILVQVEQYPDLKASQNFQELQNTLYEIEQNIAASRRFYNAAVTDYNNGLEMFPSNVVARLMGLSRKEVFSIPEIERKNINVGELFQNKVS